MLQHTSNGVTVAYSPTREKRSPALVLALPERLQSSHKAKERALNAVRNVRSVISVRKAKDHTIIAVYRKPTPPQPGAKPPLTAKQIVERVLQQFTRAVKESLKAISASQRGDNRKNERRHQKVTRPHRPSSPSRAPRPLIV